MPTVKEFTIHMEDRPGVLGKLCRGLADRGVNIVAFQSFPEQKGKSTLRFVTDNPTTTKTVLDTERTPYIETQVAQVTLAHRPGMLANAASKLGEGNININYAYAGIDPGNNRPVVIFGVAEVTQATRMLEEIAAAAA